MTIIPQTSGERRKQREEGKKAAQKRTAKLAALAPRDFFLGHTSISRFTTTVWTLIMSRTADSPPP
jgi:hypothetical protein